ncbi:MAG: nucleotide exchange factor GrpE [Calditerrivibrio sp.]|nr:nucleotide exchange factor GrpE [Calditerrivibrio sp.]MCA1932423.1 nucleotide exchange factor GrpE [Calditerrivibrio sp.]MCA1980377.1 nucleotide exchange factor GrpE [Calditerrivibrio sp.]
MTDKKGEELINEQSSEMQEELSRKDEVDQSGIADVNEVESLRKALFESNENLLRVKADAENFRKRITKEYEEKMKYANQSLLMEFLSVADNMDLALSHAGQGNEESLDKFKEGLMLILKQFKDLLAKHGMKEICCNEGDKFDPNLHDALMLDSRDDLDNNTITMVLQKGYTLHDRVVRPAKVKVNKI